MGDGNDAVATVMYSGDTGLNEESPCCAFFPGAGKNTYSLSPFASTEFSSASTSEDMYMMPG